jgi:hypothetical protein
MVAVPLTSVTFPKETEPDPVADMVPPVCILPPHKDAVDPNVRVPTVGEELPIKKSLRPISF